MGIRIIRNFIILFSFTVLYGCAATLHKGPSFIESGTPDNTQTLVYFFRIGSTPLYVDAPFYIDDVKKIDMPNKGYVPLHLQPGTYKFSIKWPVLAGQRDIEKTFTFEAGKTHYIALTKTDVADIKVLLSPDHWLGEFSKENAIDGLSQCMLVSVDSQKTGK